jgi:hypothetical protein
LAFVIACSGFKFNPNSTQFYLSFAFLQFSPHIISTSGTLLITAESMWTHLAEALAQYAVEELLGIYDTEKYKTHKCEIQQPMHRKQSQEFFLVGAA